MNRCPDCLVDAGTPHEDGCDVALCTVCGFQRITCMHDASAHGWGQVWTGLIPGTIEVRSGVAKDFNELWTLAERGDLTWDPQVGLWGSSPSHLSALPLPDHLADLASSITGEYEDKAGTGICVLVTRDRESDEGRSLTVDYRTMRHIASYLLQLAEEAEQSFLETHGVLSHLE
jgi:hypothetical protein